MSVVTRLAPSPTGMLHIGTARTGLFNWLFARRFGGQYLLRIEDTDRARSTPEAVDVILRSLDWLGIPGEGQTIYQFARAARHRDVAEEMVARGTAFRCYVTPEELEAHREAGAAARQRLNALKDEKAPAHAVEAAQAEATEFNRAFRSPYRDGLKAPSPNAPHVIRLRAPDSGEIVNEDLVQGRVVIAARDLDDLVMLRTDGTPTYMLAVVVDDHDMGVTHVIRGDDHLSNAARQIPIFDAMGWTKPLYAHLPLIHGPDGAKLSKRHGAQSVMEYRDLGYLPEAMCNYLARLGWSHGDAELFTKEEAAAWFDLAEIGRSPARLDFAKLGSVNAHHLQGADDARLLTLVLEEVARTGRWSVTPEMRTRFAAAISIVKPRAKTIVDLVDQIAFLAASRPLNLDGAAQKAIKDPARALLGRLHPRLRASADWDAATLHAALTSFAADEGVGMGQFGPALRAALSGGAPAPELAQALVLLGRDEALGRIADQLG